jgi:hypothetical protein
MTTHTGRSTFPGATSRRCPTCRPFSPARPAAFKPYLPCRLCRPHSSRPSSAAHAPSPPPRLAHHDSVVRLPLKTRSDGCVQLHLRGMRPAARRRGPNTCTISFPRTAQLGRTQQVDSRLSLALVAGSCRLRRRTTRLAGGAGRRRRHGGAGGRGRHAARGTRRGAAR